MPIIYKLVAFSELPDGRGRTRINLNTIMDSFPVPDAALGDKLRVLLHSNTGQFDLNRGRSIGDFFNYFSPFLLPGQGMRLEILPVTGSSDSLDSYVGRRLSWPGDARGGVFLRNGTDQRGQVKLRSPDRETDISSSMGDLVMIKSPKQGRRLSLKAIQVLPDVAWMSADGLFQKGNRLGIGSFCKAYVVEPLVVSPGADFLRDYPLILRKNHSKVRGDSALASVGMEAVWPHFQAALTSVTGGLSPEILMRINLPLSRVVQVKGSQVERQEFTLHFRAVDTALNYIREAATADKRHALLDQFAMDSLAALSLIHGVFSEKGAPFVYGDFNPRNVGVFSYGGNVLFGLLDADSIQHEGGGNTTTLGYFKVDMASEGGFVSQKNDRYAVAVSYLELGLNSALPSSQMVVVSTIVTFLNTLAIDRKTVEDAVSILKSLPVQSYPIHERVRSFMVDSLDRNPALMTQLLGYLIA